MDERTFGHLDERTDVRKYGYMDGRTDRRPYTWTMDGRTDASTNRKTEREMRGPARLEGLVFSGIHRAKARISDQRTGDRSNGGHFSYSVQFRPKLGLS